MSTQQKHMVSLHHGCWENMAMLVHQLDQ